MTSNHLPGGGDLTQHSVGIFSEDENAGIGFGLGFAVTLDPARAGIPGSAGDFYWGGMFSTGFFVDPVEEICMVFMTQLMPSSTYPVRRSEEHTSELQSLMRISYAVFCLKKKNTTNK